MGWTFTEFDLQPIDEIWGYWEMRSIFEEWKASRHKRGGRDDDEE